MVRRQSWRDYRAQAKAAGDPNLLALLDAGIEPKHLESAFDVMCNFEDVEFPPGDAAEPDGRKAWKALEEFWKTLEPMLPPWDAATTCKLQQRADRFRREWRFASSNAARWRRPRRAVAAVEQPGGCHPEPLADRRTRSWRSSSTPTSARASSFRTSPPGATTSIA